MEIDGYQIYFIRGGQEENQMKCIIIMIYQKHTSYGKSSSHFDRKRKNENLKKKHMQIDMVSIIGRGT